MATRRAQVHIPTGEAFTDALLRANDIAALAHLAITQLAELGAVRTCVLWNEPGQDEIAWLGSTNTALDLKTQQLAARARAAGTLIREPMENAQGIRLAKLLAQNVGAWMALVVDLNSETIDPDCKLLIERLSLRCQQVLAFQRLQQDVDRLASAERLQRALFTISDITSADLSTDEVLEGLHQIIGSLMYAENFYIVRFDVEREEVRFLYFADSNDPYIPSINQIFTAAELGNSLTLAMLRLGKAFRGPSIEVRSIMGVAQDESLGPESEDWLGVPMIEDGIVRGAVVLQSYDPLVRYSETDQVLLGYVAQHILGALSRREAQAELERQVQARTRELRLEIAERERGEQLQRALFKIAELSISSESMPIFYESVHQIVGELLDARNFYIALLSANGQEIDFPYSIDEHDRRLQSRTVGRGLSEYVLRTAQPLLVERSGVDALEAEGEVVSTGTKSVCWLGVPLLIGGRAIGVITVQSYTPDYLYTDRDEDLLSFVSFHIANALERRHASESLRLAYADMEHRVASRTSELADTNRELRDQIQVRETIEGKLKHEVLHDALTGLPNRSQLLQNLQAALTRYLGNRHHGFAVLFMDLDRFKVINDSVGHLVGDELLKEAARRITLCIRHPDMVARLGGDEFCIILNQIHDPSDAINVAERVIRSLSDPMRIAGKELFTSASIGIAFSHERYRQPDELLRDADVAMYRAKSAGRQRYALFDEHLHEDALRQLEMEGDLRRALLRDEFVPFYQPIVRLEDGVAVGFEALMRWMSPERGCVAPAGFLQIAEDSGALAQIDWQIYAQVCRDMKLLCANGAYVTINVSPRHLRSPDFCGRLLNLLEDRRVRPQSLRLEITEYALLEDPDQVLLCLSQLAAAGVLTVLDDFGTGYSSLSYLHRFPLHGLKIDRSFVEALQDGEGGSNAIIRAIRLLADSLGLDVVAEGISTEDHRQLLLSLGLTRGQGYLFARPAALTHIEGRFLGLA